MKSRQFYLVGRFILGHMSISPPSLICLKGYSLVLKLWGYGTLRCDKKSTITPTATTSQTTTVTPAIITSIATTSATTSTLITLPKLHIRRHTGNGDFPRLMTCASLELFIFVSQHKNDSGDHKQYQLCFLAFAGFYRRHCGMTFSIFVFRISKFFKEETLNSHEGS